MRLAVLLEASPPGLPPAPGPFKELRKLQLKLEKEAQWLRTKLATIERARTTRNGNKEREESATSAVFVRLKGPLLQLLEKMDLAAKTYLQVLHTQQYAAVLRIREVLELPSIIGGMIGQIHHFNSPDLLLFAVSRDIFAGMDRASKAISVAAASYSSLEF